jgi:hypothetical protein
VERELDRLGGNAVVDYENPSGQDERRIKNHGDDSRVHKLIEVQVCASGALTDIGSIRIALISTRIDFQQVQATTCEPSVCARASTSICQFATS